MPLIPIALLVASLAFGAPTALGEDVEHEISQNPETMTAYVRAYFADEPILADIAWCESRMRQYGPDGSIFRGKAVHEDVGIMQVNTHYHGEKAEELGYDLYTLSGNLAYAKYLYEKQGVKPWKSSKPCWGRAS
jgi:hypothetical protein